MKTDHHIKKYFLHKDDYQKLHFEIKDSQDHLDSYPDAVYKAHRHSFYQFIWFKNKGHHFVDFKKIEHPANSLYLLNQNQVHNFYKDSDNMGVLYHFDEVFLNKGNSSYRKRIEFELFNETQKPFIQLDENISSNLEYLTELMKLEIVNRQANYKDMIFCLMQSFVIFLERNAIITNKIFTRKSEDLELTMKFKESVVDNMDNFLSLQEYATRLNINVNKLNKLCNTYFQMSPAKYITQRKILEAQRMLTNTDVSIKEVAFALGFDQATYFTKYFKKSTGITPREFLQQINK